MSRPFPDTFEDERSPLTPLSGGPPQSISYQANVNRRKTKKWADAKPVSYGGDDWGDEYDDEYDEAPPPQEMPKPTGYRQPGQGVGGLQQPAGNYNQGRKPYGGLPGDPQMGADRSATVPHHTHRNSFGEDDERRAFSSGPTQLPPQSGQRAPQLYVQTQQQPQQKVGGFVGPGPQPMETSPIQAPVHESQRSYMGEQNQQQYQQPYQQPPYQPASPINARGIPVQPGYGRNASPVSAGRAAPAGGFAPRKSSLSQGSGSEMGHGSHSRERSQEPVVTPWPGPGVASPGGAAPPTTANALPFVRPADIYKRLEEERTKERQSMESGRPSMDSIMGERGREMSPPAAPPSSAIPPPADQYTRGRSGSQSDTYGVTDSGRRLGQSLEPVAERKSEYSFMDTFTRSPEVAQKLEDIKRTESPYQPYRKQSPEDAPRISHNDTRQHAEEPENDSSFASEESEKHRRFSTSPKLPDLNRLSGFGFDMWGAKPEEPAPEPARPVVAPPQPSVKSEEPALREQPSQSFNSVVHQAFDRNHSFSDARDPQRTDSETSVGTSDISPINTRAAFISDDQSTPMITEESEPISRRGSGHITPKQEVCPETPQQAAPFLPGHRRDLSAPISVNSRDNSPARTPVVKQTAVVGPGVQVHIAEPSEASPNSPTADEERQIEDAARYERYPRPPIPGGWTSYATTAEESVHRSDEPNVNAPADTSKIAPFTAEIIASNPLPDESSPKIAVKTEEIRPPSPEVTPVIQPPATDEHSPFVAKQMDNMAPPSPSAEHAPETKAPDALSTSLARDMDIVALPTPDRHMGPIGNPYSLAAVDPRIDSHTSQPQTPGYSKSADTITGLAPPAINEPGVSSGSSVEPTPPPKDKPRISGFGGSEYFQPLVPLKPKTAEEVAAAEGLQPPQRPGMVPTLSTSTMPYDDENDKLRKEIVKSLSPRQSLSGPSRAPHQQGQSMLGVAEQGAPRESLYLPSEYDSYWGATDDEPSQYSQLSQATPVKQQPQDVTVNVQAASPSSEDAATPPIPPLNPKRVSRTSMGSIPGITHETRYSFDQGQERRLSTDNRSDVSAPSAVAAHTPGNKQWTSSMAGNGSAKGRLPVDLQRADSASPAPLSIRSAKTDKTDKNSEVSGKSSEKPKEEDSPAQGILGMAAAAGAAVAATLLPIGGPSAEADDKPDTPKDGASERNAPSLQGVVVDEDDRINDKTLSAEVSPVSAMSPTQDIPAMMNVVSPPSAAAGAHQPQSSMSQSAMLPSPLNISRPTTAQTSHSRQAQQNQPPPMQFREIMSMQTPEQRIDAYNKTRAQYASMEVGVADWLSFQIGQAPHTPPNVGGEGRSRAGSNATPAPYYQQYLNASGHAGAQSTAASAGTPVSNMGTPQRQSTLGMMGTQSSFGGRSTSHQAQQQAQMAKEKGKELLHSAGVFGGAVGKKGKGLFKKGTSRWLGGGGDKEAPPTTPQKDPNYTPSMRSASFTYAPPAPQFATPVRSQAAREQSSASSGRRGPYPDLGPAPFRDSRSTPPFATTQQSQTLIEQSPASSGRRGPYPDLGPAQSQESPRATPTKRRTSWLPQFGSHSGRPPSRGKELDTPKRSASHDITSMLSRAGQERRQGSFDGGHRFRPPFFHHRSSSQASPAHYASPQNSFGPQYASPQNSFGPGVQCASQEGSYIGTPGTQGTRQRSDSLPLPPGVTIESREVPSIASGTPPLVAPPVAPQIHLDLPPATLRDEHCMSTSPAHTGSPHISAASSHHHSNSPRPSNANSSRHHSGVPSLTDSQRLENEERRDSFNVDKELPSLLHVQDDHEHTGVKPPVPIGKYQPSWDPFNATPIQEEREGSEYSFGAGKISPPKLSPPNLETVNEGGSKHQDASQNSTLAGAAGNSLAAGAVTTVAAVAEQVADYKEIAEHKEEQQERKTEINTTEVDEDDLYDASPPPKSKRRSMDLRPAVPLGLAAGTVTTTTAIHEHVEERKHVDEKDEDWEVVKHADIERDVERDERVEAMVKEEESYFPPITERFTTATPPQAHNIRLDLDNTQDRSTGHSRNISSVSAVLAMTDTGTQGEIVQAEEVTLARQSSTQVVQDATAAPPTIQSIVHGIPWTPDDDTPDGDGTPGGEGLQTFTPPRAGFMGQPPQNTIQNIVHDISWSPTPEDDGQIFTPPRPGFMGQPAQTTPTMEGVPGFFPSTPSVSESPESIRVASEKDKPLPPIDKELPYEHPDDISNKATTRLLMSQPPGGPHTIDRTAWKAVTSEIKREETPSVVSSVEDDEKPYAAALARLDNVRNNTQQISGELHPEQRSFDEAEHFRVQNAQIVAQSRELEPRERAFDEAEEFRVQNAETVEMAGGVTAWTAMTSHVIAERGQDNSPRVGSEQDDEKPYVVRESEPRQRAFDEADKFRVQNARIIEKADGGAAAGTATTSSVSEEDDDDDEKPYVMTLARLDNVRNSTQQIGNELQPQQGMVQSRESKPRQRSFNEAEQIRVQNAQAANEGGAKIDRKSEGDGVLASAAGLGLAAGAATTAHVIAEQAQESREQREIEVNPAEIDEDDIYDASPPPKSKRRSMDMRPAVSLGPSVSSLPPPGPIPGAIGQRGSPTGGTPVLTPQPGRGLVPSEFTARTASTAFTVQPPPVLAQERMVNPRSPLDVAPVQQQRQFSPPVHHDQTVYRHSTSQIRQAPHSQPPQGQPPGPLRLQHQDAEYGGKTPEVGARDSWFKRLPMHQQQRMSQPPPQQQQLTNEERMFQQHQGVPSRAPAVQPQPMRHPSTEIVQQQTMRETQSPGAVGQRGSPTGVTPVLAPQQGRGPVPSEYTPRTGSAASSISQGPPVLAQERTTTARSPLGVTPVQQQRQFPPPIPQNRNQNQTAYQQSADQIGGTPYNRLSQGPPLGPPRGQHQTYAQQLAQVPPQLKKTNSDANRHVLQKRPSSAASSQKGKEVKEKNKSWLSGLLGGRRKSSMAEKEKEKDRKSGDVNVPLVAVPGATGMAAHHQLQSPQNEERQRYSLPPPQHQMSGGIPTQGQQFDARDPSFLQWQKQQQQQVLMAPAGLQRQLQGGPQREQQQRYASPPIPGPYAYVRGDGSHGPVNQGPMILNPHQQQQAAGFRQPEQPVFTDQRSYDEYMRQQQAAQAQQQGHYANLPPPPAQSYYQGTQESVPPNFRRASQEYVRNLNQRSSQENSRRDSNPMAGGQQLNQTYTQQQASQRPQSQRKEPIAVAIPAWKRAIRDTPGTTSPVQRSEPSPPVLGPQGDFPHLTAYNPSSNKTPDTPEPQGHLRPFLGLNDGRRKSNLSTEDLLARSPARAQFGQQAPYQLSLPGGDDDEELDSPHSRRSPPNALVGVAAAGTLGAAAASSHRNLRQSASSPLRESHQHQASNVPVPETAFSPIADRGDGRRAGEIPPPLLPKWSAPPTPSEVVQNVQLGHPTHQSGVGLLQPAGQPLLHQQGQMLSPIIGVGRSNTVMSDVSSVTVDSSVTPSPRQNATMMGGAGQGHGHEKSIFAASPIMGQQLSQVTTRDSVSPRSSPNDTPVVGNAMSVQPIRPSVTHHRTEPVVQRIHIPSDVRSPPLPVPQESQAPPPMPTARAPSPPHPPVPAANATGGFVIADDRAPAERPTVLTQHPDHSGLIYDNSREGLIVVEDATVRRVNQGQAARTPEDDEGPVMSATSFPGDEWRPYGWDDGGFD